MTLDLAAVSRQIEAMGAPLQEAGRARRSLLERALEAMAALAGRAEELRTRVEDRFEGVIFPLAGLADDPCRRYPPPVAPPDYAVVAVDGSQITVDRHHPLPCYLVNVGSAVLRYGAQPDARLSSRPQLCYRDEDLYIANPADPDRRERIEGALLSARRDVEECAELSRLVAALPPALPALALLDNSLILWGLVGRRFEEYVKDQLLGQYFHHLDAVRASGETRPLAVAGYTSRPDGDNVVNTLRLSLCQQADCQQCKTQSPPGRRDCDALAGLADRELFAALLKTPGERSALFVNLMRFSGTVERYYRGNEVHFFYLNAGEEIARVELPKWVAQDSALVELTHALAYDQIRRGDGYPVALAEAHEQAVVAAPEQEQFWYLVETMAAERGLSLAPSAKVLSKRMRGV